MDASPSGFLPATWPIPADTPAEVVLPCAAAAGDALTISFSMLAPPDTGGADGQAGAVCTVLLPSAEKPVAIWQQIVIVGEAQESFRLAFTAPSSWLAGAATLRVHASYFRRSLRLDGLTVINHGRVDAQTLARAVCSYPGQEPDAPWRAEAARRISRHRMAELSVAVTGRDGRPLPDAVVQCEQQRHAYPFGTAVVAARMVDAEVPLPEGVRRSDWLADNARYRDELQRLFTCAVFENDQKWPFWSGSLPGRFRQQDTLAAIEALRQRGFDLKGHTMLWASWKNTPTWLRPMAEDPAAVQRAILAHIRDLGSATGAQSRWFDVLNEPMSHNELITLLGHERAAAWFAEARRVMPGTRLVLNEFDMIGNGGSAKRQASFLDFVRSLRRHGAPIDVLGFQGHFWSDRLTPPTEVWRIIDRFHDETGLPLMISEFDMNMPNEALQAAYTRDLLTAWFAHPATEAFIMWGFWGGAHWMRDAGAMFRADWSAKPNLAAYRDLVFGQWWTRAEAACDGTGWAGMRAFHGTHRVRVSAPGHAAVERTVVVGAAGASLSVVLSPLG